MDLLSVAKKVRVHEAGGTPVWWIDYSYRGERKRESSKSTRKKDAQALLRQRMKEMAEGGPMVDEEDVIFSDLREVVENDYKVNGNKSLDRVKLAFDHLEDYFNGWRAVDITTDRVDSYIASRRDDGAANSTINKELNALRRGYNLMQEAGRLSRAPHVRRLRTNNARQDFLTMEDVDAICAELEAHPYVQGVAPVVRFAALTGWRKGEIIAYDGSPGLQWSSVDFEAGEVRLEPGTTKNDEARTFPFAALPPLEDLLRRQRERTRAVEKRRDKIVPYVFHRDGEPINSIRTAWNKAAKRAGLEGAWFHDLRRTAARNLIRAGVSRSVAKKLLGHKSDSIFDRYAVADSVALREGVEKLASLHDSAGEREERSAVSLDEAREG